MGKIDTALRLTCTLAIIQTQRLIVIGVYLTDNNATYLV